MLKKSSFFHAHHFTHERRIAGSGYVERNKKSGLRVMDGVWLVFIVRFLFRFCRFCCLPVALLIKWIFPKRRISALGKSTSSPSAKKAVVSRKKLVSAKEKDTAENRERVVFQKKRDALRGRVFKRVVFHASSVRSSKDKKNSNLSKQATVLGFRKNGRSDERKQRHSKVEKQTLRRLRWFGKEPPDAFQNGSTTKPRGAKHIEKTVDRSKKGRFESEKLKQEITAPISFKGLAALGLACLSLFMFLGSSYLYTKTKRIQEQVAAASQNLYREKLTYEQLRQNLSLKSFLKEDREATQSSAMVKFLAKDIPIVETHPAGFSASSKPLSSSATHTNP